MAHCAKSFEILFLDICSGLLKMCYKFVKIAKVFKMTIIFTSPRAYFPLFFQGPGRIFTHGSYQSDLVPYVLPLFTILFLWIDMCLNVGMTVT